MALTEYKKKRDFKKTPEPTAKKEASGKNRFVVQEHHASHLHYDFRMEFDGVLTSWAVPKGPSMNPADKRLAVMTEDHPVKYLHFEGDIPEGNYGAGHMEIWDSGTYEMAEDAASYKEGLEAGSLKFVLHGKKLKGIFKMVEMHGHEKRQWLLIKADDEYAEHAKGKTKESAVKKKLKTQAPNKTKEPSDATVEFIRPMLAKLVDQPFDDKDWLFEPKLDGYRAIAEIDQGKVRLYSRTGQAFESRYKPIVEALMEIPHEAVLDGEVVLLGANGNPDFNSLQNFITTQKGQLRYYVFDLLRLNGEDTTSLPLLQRKELLQTLLKGKEIITYCEHQIGEGKQFFELMRKEGLEGMMAKKSNSQYTFGLRTSEWLKVKIQQTADTIIGGFTEAKDSREFGALLLGMYDDEGQFQFIGHCGTGFNREEIKDMRAQFRPWELSKCPFAKKPVANAAVTWLSPKFVCEVSFTEWTKAGLLRHPAFLHLRNDKPAEEVLISPQKDKIMEPEKEKKTKAAPTSSTRTPSEGDSVLKIGKSKVPVTSLDKIYYPDDHITKGDILDYYIQIGEYMLPYLKNRAESLHRFPNGMAGGNFYQKDINFKVPEFADTVVFYSEGAEKDIDWLVCNNLETLIFMVNLGTLEINPWNSTIDKPDHPSYAAIDLDPGDKTEFSQVIETALVIKEILDSADIDAYCKTSGSRGIHIFIPMNAKYHYDDVRDFVKSIMLIANNRLPNITSLERSPSVRRNKIYLDYLQNKQGQTLVAPYSVRPKPGATVSAPLHWNEVNEKLKLADYNIETMPERLKRIGDIWKPVLGKGIDMEKALKKLMEE